MKAHFYMKGWVPSLALGKRLKKIQKRPIAAHQTYKEKLLPFYDHD